MKKLNFLLPALLVSSFLFSQSVEKRLALVIGNSAYQNGGILKNSVNDANLMASTLQQLGFDVIVKINADLKTMQMAEDDFRSKLSQYKVALFYFAGHGIQVDGKNFLIPIDAKLDKRELTKYEALDISIINEAFMAYTENVNIMILDACRNNPFRTWERGGERGFKKIETSSTGTIIAFATQPGATAADGTGSNGLYTSQLVKQMVKSQSIEQVFKMTRIEVNKYSNGKQIPQDWSSLMANFYFTKTNIELNADVIVDNSLANTNTMIDFPDKGIFVDLRDSQEYSYLKFGEQFWMTKNMNYKTTGRSWCYDNINSNCKTYGRFYNWETAKKACPDGWHIPSDGEWKELLTYLGGEKVAGTKMKIGGKTYYDDFGTNSSGFSGLLSGYRNDDGTFSHSGCNAAFWTSSESNSTKVWCRYLSCVNSTVHGKDGSKDNGYSVRCVKDY